MTRANFSYSILIVIFSILLSGKSYSITSHSSKQYVVVIDPGHGGQDPGAVNKSIREKDIVLGIGLKLGKLINENQSDVKVIFTRSTDVFIPLIERTRIANKNKADLFISIHANFCATPAIKGTETFVLGLEKDKENLEVAKNENSVIIMEENYNTTYEGYDPNSSESQIMFENYQSAHLEQSLLFADAVQQQFRSRFSVSDRGVKQAGFLVLRQSSMPSVLIESGFISNPNEANYLNSEDGQQQIAASIYEAFKKFKGKGSGLSPVGTNTVLANSQKGLETNSKVKKADTIVPKKTEVKKADPVIAQVEPKKNMDSIVPKKTEEKKEQVVMDTTKPVKKEKEPAKVVKTEPKDTTQVKESKGTIYCVQILASTVAIKEVPANFKGLTDIKSDKLDKYFRYYVGSENTIDKIIPQLQQIRQKFPQAFIVSFVNGKRIPIYGR